MCLAALDTALEFQEHLVIPSTWKTEVKEESSSSEDEEEDEDEDQEEDASGEEEEVDAEMLTRFSAHHVRLKVQLSCFLSAGGSGAVPRGEGELSAAALQVHGGQR